MTCLEKERSDKKSLRSFPKYLVYGVVGLPKKRNAAYINTPLVHKGWFLHVVQRSYQRFYLLRVQK
jgi:hypothetical protein